MSATYPDQPVSGTHAQRPSAGLAGRTYFETDTGVMYLDTGSAWVGISTGFVYKNADEIVNNSATLQNDDHLFWPIEIGEIWSFELLLRLQGQGTAADYKFGWTGPAGATVEWGVEAAQADFAPGSMAAVPVGTTPSTTLQIGDTMSVGASGFEHFVRLGGTARSLTNAGTIQFQWAQNTQTAVDNRVRSRSWLSLRRLA